MNRITLLFCLISLFGCSGTDKYKGKYELFKHSYNSNNTLWVLFDRHDGYTVDILHLENPINADERGHIEGGYYIEDTPPSHWNFPTFNTFSFKNNYSSLSDAIDAADSEWYRYKKKMEGRYSQNGKNLVLDCSNCETPTVFNISDMP